MGRVLLAIAISVAVAACAGGDQTIGVDAVDTTSGLATPTTRAESGQTVRTGASGEPRTIELVVASPPVYDSGSGVTLTIGDARVGDLNSVSAEALEELSIALENSNSQSLLILTITVVNSGDRPVGFFPDQATALVGSAQVGANFLLSESFTGGAGTILDGASITKDVYFELSQSADDVAGLGRARYTTSGPFDYESFESIGGDVDLIVEWSGSSG